jgi:Spy/CpxP family protein refolding chaperone
MKSALILAIGLTGVLGNSAAAQRPEPEPEFAKYLFAPELVLKYSRQIELQPPQRTALMQLLKEVQVDVMDLQLQMAESATDLTAEVEKQKVDEAAALRLTDRILTLERDIKKRQMTLLIRLKNLLTADQQAKLTTLRDREAKQGGDEGTEQSNTGTQEE